MNPSRLLRKLLAESYDSFDHYQQPKILEASPLRDAKNLLRQLTSKPLRFLGVEDVTEYASAAVTTVGTIADYKHFLPRLLGLAVESALIEPEVIALKLRLAGWRAWPQGEQQIVEKIFIAACEDAFQQHIDEYLADGWLCGIAIIGIDYDAVLHKLASSGNAFCALQVSHLTICLLRPSGNDELGYWSETTDTDVETIRIWLLSQNVHQLLSSTRLSVRPDDIWFLDEALKTREVFRRQLRH